MEIVVMGRCLSRRFLNCSSFIVVTFLPGRFARRDEAYGILFQLDMDDKQEIPARVHADNGITGFLVPARLPDLPEGIEKGLCGLLERNPIMVPRILPCLVFVPDERDALQDKARIHGRHLSRKIYTTSIQRSGVMRWMPKIKGGSTATVEAERPSSAAAAARGAMGRAQRM